MTEEDAGRGGRRESLLLAGLTTAGFLATTAGLSLTPFLLAVAHDLQTDIGAISALFTFSNIAWGATSLVSGQVSDRFGRKPILLAGLGLSATASLGSALAQDYSTQVFWRTFTGLSGGIQTPTIYAATADLVAPARRGKALGWVMTGQSLSLVIGAPLAAQIGALSNWRWATGTLGLLALLLLLVLAWLLPATRASRGTGRSAPGAGIGRLLAQPRVLALYGLSAFERVCYSSVVIFFATYLLVTYDVAPVWLGGLLMISALGGLAGNQLGGRLADQVDAKHLLLAAAMIGTAVLAFPLLTSAPGLLLTVVLGLLYNLASSVGRPSLLWLISNLSLDARGAVLGLNVAAASVGWLTASAIGGWLVATQGFGALAVLACLSGVAAALCALLVGRSSAPPAPAEDPLRQAASPAR